jgi:ADP-heptose:LPS heptosyltransferase
MAEKFLVIQTAFIGDVVLATGLCEKLHNRFPNAEIHILVRKGNEGLFEKHPFVKVMIWEKKTSKYKNLVKLLFRIRKLKFTKVINIQRYAATGFLTAFSGAKERVGFDKNPFSRFFTKTVTHEFGRSGDNPVHEIERNNKLIEHFTDSEVFKPKLYPGKEEHVKLERYKRLPYITISPASVWFTKQWPIEKWLAFLDIMPYDFSVYVLGGPGDVELGNRIKQNTSNPYVINFCGKLNYLESLSMIKDATMNYVNDSAPMHFASAVNAPVTAIYCSTVPSFGYGPLSDHSQILQFPGELYCRPCGLHGHNTCPEGHFRCALEIDPKSLLDVLPPAQIPSFQRNH